jgi:hypothetical protein
MVAEITTGLYSRVSEGEGRGEKEVLARKQKDLGLNTQSRHPVSAGIDPQLQ